MNLVKRIFFYVLIVLALAGAVWAYFHLKNTKQPSLKAINVLPDSAICIIASHNFNELANKLSNQNLIWNEVVNIKEFNALHKHIQFYDSIISENEMLKDFFKDHTIYLALYNNNSAVNYLITFNLNDLAQEREFAEALNRSIKGLVKTEFGYEFTALEKKCILKLQQGVVAISNNSSQIENAFASQNSKVAKNKTVMALLDLNKEDDLLNIYVNHQELSAVKKTTEVNADDLILSGHSVCNTEIYPDEISLNGFNKPDSSSLLNALSNQQAQTCDFLAMLPFNTVSFKALGFGDFLMMRKKFKIEMSGSKKFWKQINDNAMFNAELEFYEAINTKIIETELAQNGAFTKALLIEIKDTTKVLELMQIFSDSIAVYQNAKLAHLDSNTINIAAASFGNAFNIKAQYAFVTNNYFILLENKNDAEYYINALNTNAVLTQNEFFTEYAKENLGLNFNYIYYSSINKNPRPVKLVFQFLKAEDVKHSEKLSDFCISISNYKSLLQFRVNLKYQQIRKDKETPSLWTLEADTLIQTKPWPFANHKTNENELVFQDAKNDLYLVNATGNVIWKKHINEAILSEVYTIDAFKNNKFQMLFNTENYLHLIDRNGEYVAGYPLKLPAKATNKLTLMDYEGKRDYRLFIACADDKIYNYNANGSKNEGFAAVKTQEPVTLPIKYAKVGLSDYLLAVDAEGKIYVFGRKGDGRIDIRNRVIGGCNDFFVDAGSNLKETKLIYLDDKSSLLNKISLEDKKETVKLSNDFEEANVSFDLIDDDKKTDILIAAKTGAFVFDFAGNRMFNYTAENAEFKDLIFQMDVENTLFLANNIITNEVNVINPSTAVLKNKYPASQKPLMMDVFKDGKKYLLLINNKTMSCVMLN